MGYLLIAILVFLVVLLLTRQIQNARLLRALSRALENRQPYLSHPGQYVLSSPAWRKLLRQLNMAIEERREVERERADKVGQLQATLANMVEAVIILDLNQRVVLINESFNRMFPRSSLKVGHRLDTALQNDPFVAYVDRVRNADQPGQVEIEFISGGQSIWVEVTGTRIPGFSSEAGKLSLFVLHNITRLKQLESIRKEFVANVSHELRTPLSIVKGYAETLEDAGNEMTAEMRREFLQTIHRHADRLNALLEDLLALSRLEGRNPRMVKELFCIENLMRQLTRDYTTAELLGKRTMQLVFDPEPVPLEVDVGKMTQVLENLVDNAIKYSPAESTIELGSRREEGFVQFWVKDNGTGIAQKDLPHIFERFYRVDKGRSREKGGTGLGLSIVKHIIQLHGGLLQAESVLGQGTTIRFRLPLPAAGKK